MRIEITWFQQIQVISYSFWTMGVGLQEGNGSSLGNMNWISKSACLKIIGIFDVSYFILEYSSGLSWLLYKIIVNL